MSLDENQLSAQSVAFNDANKQEIALVRKLLLKGATALSLALNGAKLHTSTGLQEKLDAGDLDGSFTLVRSMACSVAATELSQHLWAWVDAAGFLADCTSTRWKYLSIEQRQKYLKWARQDAQRVLSAQ